MSGLPDIGDLTAQVSYGRLAWPVSKGEVFALILRDAALRAASQDAVCSRNCHASARSVRMMRLAIDRCFADLKVTAILIDPLARNIRGRRFYERLGFLAVEQRRFGTNNCVVYRLGREVWNRCHENTEVPEHSAPRHYRSSCEKGRVPDAAGQKLRAGTNKQVTSKSPKGS